MSIRISGVQSLKLSLTEEKICSGKCGEKKSPKSNF